MASKSSKLTESDVRLLAHVWYCFDADLPKIVFKNLADRVGHTNPNSTYNAWTSVKEKLAIVAAEPISPKRKRKNARAQNDGSPTKSPRSCGSTRPGRRNELDTGPFYNGKDLPHPQRGAGHAPHSMSPNDYSVKDEIESCSVSPAAVYDGLLSNYNYVDGSVLQN